LLPTLEDAAMPRRAAMTLTLLFLSTAVIHAQTTYQKAPKLIADVLNAPTPPLELLSPTRDRLLLIETARYPTIAELSEPMLRLAGLRINPATFGPHALSPFVGLTLLEIDTGKRTKVEVPHGSRLGSPTWSPDGIRLAFTRATAKAIELWIADVATGKARPIPDLKLNAVLGEPFHWLPDGKTLVCKIVAQNGQPPEGPRAPAGPIIQESDGKKAPARTHQDLLQTDHDEALFEYYATSQIARVEVETGSVRPFTVTAVFAGVAPSPDGKLLLVTTIKRPYSRLLTWTAFPHDVAVWETSAPSGIVTSMKVASLPLADKVPIDGVPTGPRNPQWLPTEPATLLWVEALDDGDPKKKAPFRDAVQRYRVFREEKPQSILRTEQRFASLSFADKGGPALLSDYDRNSKHRRTFLVDLAKQESERKLLWDLSINERYKHPGTPLTTTLPNGQSVLETHDGKLFLQSRGSTPQGDRPFLDQFDPQTGKTRHLFRCEEGCYETPYYLLSEDGSRFLTRRETPTEPPNYYVRTADGKKQALTDFQDPTPHLRAIEKKLVTYKRADGVPLSFTLYLPPDYKEGTRLPAFISAYPLEYTDADTAGQVSGSPYTFTTFQGPSFQFFVLQGYAVLEPTMPIVGDPEKVNDTFVEQLIANAKAAILKADEMGVIDRKRVAVGGHSYGAFMTANLLAHSDLFRAGIARSGAYNRTLTPFGFQSERRTLWEAPETYLKMSPFMYADKIKTPLLLIHGAADNNDGTFPIQSERMYQAVKGNGGTVRLVMLPYESHGYAARESVEHTLVEMMNWLDKHVKNAK
jgi:dipeptidyl aminopeptidase/acylaminoacyl peptidase